MYFILINATTTPHQVKQLIFDAFMEMDEDDFCYFKQLCDARIYEMEARLSHYH